MPNDQGVLATHDPGYTRQSLNPSKSSGPRILLEVWSPQDPGCKGIPESEEVRRTGIQGSPQKPSIRGNPFDPFLSPLISSCRAPMYHLEWFCKLCSFVSLKASARKHDNNLEQTCNYLVTPKLVLLLCNRDFTFRLAVADLNWHLLYLICFCCLVTWVGSPKFQNNANM